MRSGAIPVPASAELATEVVLPLLNGASRLPRTGGDAPGIRLGSESPGFGDHSGERMFVDATSESYPLGTPCLMPMNRSATLPTIAVLAEAALEQANKTGVPRAINWGDLRAVEAANPVGRDASLQYHGHLADLGLEDGDGQER